MTPSSVSNLEKASALHAKCKRKSLQTQLVVVQLIVVEKHHRQTGRGERKKSRAEGRNLHTVVDFGGKEVIE